MGEKNDGTQTWETKMMGDKKNRREKDGREK